MTEVIVDTDVLSFLFKNHPIGQLYDADLAGRAGGVSFMTVAEVERWALQYRWGAQRGHWLRLFVERFTVVPDAWMAATALLYDTPLVTHNWSDFLGVPGLKLISHGQ